MGEFSLATRHWVKSQRRSFLFSLRFWLKRWRSAFIRSLEKFFVGNSLTSILVQDISSLCRLDLAMDKVKSVRLLEDAQVIRRSTTTPAQLFPAFGDSRRAIFRYELANSRIHLQSGLANVCGGFLVEELFGHYAVIFGGGSVVHEYASTLKGARFVKGVWAIVPVPLYYYHFITQTLPTILRCLEHKDLEGVIVSNQMPSWAREALNDLGTKIFFVDDEVVEIERYVCCSVPQISSPSDVMILRSQFSHSIENKSHYLAYVGRTGRSRNFGKLESDIEDLVTNRNGISVDPEKLGWKKEIEFFANCDAAIMVYGSAMANVVWMKPGSKVLMLTNFDGFTTQIEKSLFDSSGIRYTEFNVSGISSMNERLSIVLQDFIESP